MDKVLTRVFSQITGFDSASDPTFVDRTVILPVHLLAGLLYDETKKFDNVKVHWGYKFVDLTQDDSHVSVKAEHDGKTETFHADFVVGCDGARSAVRKVLFDDVFQGKTWDVQIVAMNAGFISIILGNILIEMLDALRWIREAWMVRHTVDSSS